MVGCHAGAPFPGRAWSPLGPPGDGPWQGFVPTLLARVAVVPSPKDMDREQQ